ncbi:MAG TPA: hypothetical protein VLF63_01390 [Patescibacteria group bacterium]|nr:hypothetical protein [Patescibacteria group bacterium]
MSEELVSNSDFEVPIVESEIVAKDTENHSKHNALDWIRQQKVKLALGATVLSLAVTGITNPNHKVMSEVEHKVEWVAPSLVGLDISLGVGFSLMLLSTGTVVKNPFKAKSYIKNIVDNANDSKLFKSGFLLSTASGLAWGGIATESIVTTIPPHGWAALAFPLTDLSLTVWSRKTIWGAMKKNKQNSIHKQDIA